MQLIVSRQLSIFECQLWQHKSSDLVLGTDLKSNVVSYTFILYLLPSSFSAG